MEGSVGVTHFTSAAIVVYAMNRLKSASWFPLLQKDWTAINRAFSVVVALLISWGIHYVWTADPNGGHQLVLEIPAWSTLGFTIWHWLNQYAMQETLHQITKPKTP